MFKVYRFGRDRCAYGHSRVGLSDHDAELGVKYRSLS